MTPELLTILSDFSIGLLALALLFYVLRRVFDLALQALQSKEKVILELIKLLGGKVS